MINLCLQVSLSYCFESKKYFETTTTTTTVLFDVDFIEVHTPISTFITNI